MQILGIMVVKNEADVIASTLQEAMRWIDRLFILDNGSTDGTWQIVCSFEGNQIVPWKQDSRPFSTTMRAEVFNAFRHEAQPGDWWCHRMDADEFYVDDPRKFLARIPRSYHVVYKRSIEYVLTPEDIAEQDFVGDFSQDREKIRHFRQTAHAEKRFFRHRPRFHWALDEETPKHIGIPYPLPITVQHFPRRSPEQIKTRLALRHAVPKDGRGKPFRHVTETDWRETLVPSSDTIRDDGSVNLGEIPLRKSFEMPKLKELWYRFLYASGILP
jgi:hypothetical protein